MPAASVLGDDTAGSDGPLDHGLGVRALDFGQLGVMSNPSAHTARRPRWRCRKPGYPLQFLAAEIAKPAVTVIKATLYALFLHML